MKEFKVLPTEKRWLDLSQLQLNWIIESMNRDVEAENLARSGKQQDEYFEDYEKDWLDVPDNEWTVVRDGDDEAAIAKQVEDITSPEDMAVLKARLEASEEADKEYEKSGTTIEEDSINEYIANNIQKAVEDAQRIEKHMGNETSKEKTESFKKEAEFQNKISNKGVQQAMDLFEGKKHITEDDLPTSDDDFVI